MPEGRNINALDAMSASGDALVQFGGHAVAAGFELEAHKADLFKSRLESHFAEKLVQGEPRMWVYDAEATLSELCPQFMTWYEHLSPFGAQFAPPVFFLRNIHLQQARQLKGGHYRLTLAESSAVSRVALWFSPPKGHVLLSAPEADQSRALETIGRVDALVEPQWNYYSGRKSLQLLVQDLKPAT